jgi:hypothetical protein
LRRDIGLPHDDIEDVAALIKEVATLREEVARYGGCRGAPGNGIMPAGIVWRAR